MKHIECIIISNRKAAYKKCVKKLGTRRFFIKIWLFSGFKQSLFPNENKPVTSKKPKSQKKKDCEKFVKTWRVTQLLLFVLYYWKVGERDGLTFSGEFIWKKFYPGTVNQNLEFYSEIVGEKSRPVFVKFMFYEKAIFCFDDSTIYIVNAKRFLRKHEL